jgi:predicted ATPase/DNA-binding SARP family transcriptional activator
LNKEIAHRREKLAGMLWPDSTESNARSYLRKALWQARKSLGAGTPGGEEYMLADDISISFNSSADYWLDADAVSSKLTDTSSVEEQIEAVSAYHGDLLPGFYDEWVLLERERVKAAFDQTINKLLSHLIAGGQWERVVYWSEQWIALGEAPEPAFRALMVAHANMGDMAKVAAAYERCVEALSEELGVNPSEQTKMLFADLQKGKGLAISTESSDQVQGYEYSGKQQIPTARQRQTNLTASLTSFIGREQEIREVKQLIAASRLVTLTGPGGCGKTRLALHVAESFVDQVPDGVWLIELASLTNPDLVPEHTAIELGLVKEQSRPPIESLLDHLRDSHAILLFDNCEHLIEACAALIDLLLRSCESLKVLATSREALNIPGEAAWIVPSLAFPDPGEAHSVDSLIEYDAIRLFVERAEGAGNTYSFELTEANAETVARTCQRLDGIPLAVELAAARLKSLTIAQIATRLDDRFHLLTGGSRTALHRQQTLRATMDWSYDLLPSAEQAMFRYLAGFTGGWTLEGAEGIIRPAPDAFLPDSEKFIIEDARPLDLLTNLMEKSLVTREGQIDNIRYGMLETMRDFGREKLQEAGEESSILDRHLEMFMRLAEKIGPLLHADQLIWLDRLEAELDNIRAAIKWSIDGGTLDDTMGSELRVVAGLRLLGSLDWFFERHNRRAPIKPLMQLLSHPAAKANTSWRAKALNTCGFIHMIGGNYKESQRVLEEALHIARELDDIENIIWALGRIGAVLTLQGKYADSQPYLEEGLGFAIEMGNEGQFAVAWCQSFLGDIYLNRGEIEKAESAYEESVAILRNLENQSMLGLSVRRLGILALRRGDIEEATRIFEESLLLNQAVNHTQGIAQCFAALAGAAAMQGDIVRAARLMGATEAVVEAIAIPMYRNDQNEFDLNMVDVRAQLGDEQIRAAWSEGQSMSLEEAIAYAMTPKNLGVRKTADSRT